MRSVLIILSLYWQGFTASYSDASCSKDDPLCSESRTNEYIDIDRELARIENLRQENINKAYEEIKLLDSQHPGHPNILFLLSKVQRKLYSKLHVKMRDVGKIELLHPSLENLKKILLMPEEKVSNGFHAEVAEFSVGSAMSSGNKNLSVELVEALLKRPNKEIPQDKYRDYFELLVEEMFYAKLYQKAMDLIGTVRNMFKGPHIELKFLNALMTRYNEVVNKQPFVVSHDLLKKIKPKTDDDKRELVYFINEVEAELRRQKRLVELDVMFELGEELGLFPSKYQRPNMFMSELRASTVWSPEDSGQGEQLTRLVNNWGSIATELVNLTSELEDWEWREGANFDKYDVYWFVGDGQVELPKTGCDVAPTFCDVIKNFSSLRDCVLCEIKVLYLEPGAHLRPSVGPTNAKLTAVIPITPKVALNQHSLIKLRVGAEKVQWKENEPTIIDASFEHEMWNSSNGAKLVLMIDFKHPDVPPEEDFMDPKHWDILNVEGKYVYQMKESIAS